MKKFKKSSFSNSFSIDAAVELGFQEFLKENGYTSKRLPKEETVYRFKKQKSRFKKLLILFGIVY